MACNGSLTVDASKYSNSVVAAVAPSSWAAINGSTSIGRIPVKLSVIERARVTAGLAKEVEAVNQYAAVM